MVVLHDGLPLIANDAFKPACAGVFALRTRSFLLATGCLHDPLGTDTTGGVGTLSPIELASALTLALRCVCGRGERRAGGGKAETTIGTA